MDKIAPTGINDNDVNLSDEIKNKMKVVENNDDVGKLQNILTNADFNGLVPEEFYNGIDTRTLDDGKLAKCSQELQWVLENFGTFLQDWEAANGNGSNNVQNVGVNLSKGFLAGAMAITVPVKLFCCLVDLFTTVFGFNKAGDLTTTDPANSKSSGSGSSYSGSSYFDPSSYNFDFDDEEEEEEEDEVKDDTFDDEVYDDDFEFEEEVEEEDEDEDLSKDEEEPKKEDDSSSYIEPETNTNAADDKNKVNGNQIIDEIKDASGKTVAVSVIANGKKRWYQVVGDNVIVPTEEMSSFNVPQDMTITVDGKEQTINSGSYPVDQVIYNADGSVRSVRFICDDKKIWAQLDSSGNIVKYDYIVYEQGLLTLTDGSYDKIDMYGNNVGKFSAGSYSINEVMYDSNGNAIAYKLTGSGVYEEWLYPNGNTDNMELDMIVATQTNAKSSVSTFKDNKGLYGLLGILFVALGATLVVRKKIKDKENAENSDSEEYTDDSYVEESLPTGNYGIYDVKKNDEGVITEARISPDNSSDEYWVEV